MSSNHVEVTSPEHFRDLLSADLKRVSCLNFWAPWAEPCAAFNQEIEAAAAKYPSVLFLKVSTRIKTVFRRARTRLDRNAARGKIMLPGDTGDLC